MVAGRIHADAGATVSTEQLDFYHREGYLHLRGVLAPDLLSLTEYVLSRWVDETVAQWLGEGRIADRQQDLDFQHRLVQLWHDAGRPKYSRSPRRDLVSPEMYRILVHPVLLDVAEDLLGTPELSVHGIFNARPKLPDQIWTRTSWHQDAQYYRDAADGHVVSLWYPLQAVSERNSCLQVAQRMHRGPLYDGHHDEETRYRLPAPPRPCRPARLSLLNLPSGEPGRSPATMAPAASSASVHTATAPFTLVRYGFSAPLRQADGQQRLDLLQHGIQYRSSGCTGANEHTHPEILAEQHTCRLGPDPRRRRSRRRPGPARSFPKGASPGPRSHPRRYGQSPGRCGPGR